MGSLGFAEAMPPVRERPPLLGRSRKPQFGKIRVIPPQVLNRPVGAMVVGDNDLMNTFIIVLDDPIKGFADQILPPISRYQYAQFHRLE